MLHEDGELVGRPVVGQWPPEGTTASAEHPHGFMTRCSKEGGKKVAWPPYLDSEGNNPTELLNNNPDQVPPPVPPRPVNYTQNEGGVNMTTTYPSGFKLREEAPIQQPGPRVVPSQPAFKITQPVKTRGDSKWPPRQNSDEPVTQEQVREFIKPKKQNRDYSEFFAQNALPGNYTGYRPPPGTQHVRAEDLEEMMDPDEEALC